MAFASISVKSLYELVSSGTHVDLIDVRTPVEFREIRVSGARNVPLDQLNPSTLAAARNGARQPLYVICRTGNRSSKACEKLEAAGWRTVVNVEGGTSAWEQAGLPVVRGKKTISLERQVRIAAGLLVVLGALLGAFVSLHWIWLSAAVGAGLAIAGITDACGMAMILAKMPWNRVADDDSSRAASGALQNEARDKNPGSACCP